MKVENSNIVEIQTDTTRTNNQPVNKVENSSSSDLNVIQQVRQTQQARQAEEQQTETSMNRDELQQVAEKLQDFVGSLNTSLQFSVDEESGRDVIKVMDKDSGELVRQFPSEEVLDVIKSLSNATGMLFDETA